MQSIEDFKNEVFERTGVNFDEMPDLDMDDMNFTRYITRRGRCFVVFLGDPRYQDEPEFEPDKRSLYGVMNRAALQETPTEVAEYYRLHTHGLDIGKAVQDIQEQADEFVASIRKNLYCERIL